MRHNNKVKTFDRKKASREALFRSLAESVILRERVETTQAKAKYVRPLVEKLITLGKKRSLHAQREILKQVYTQQARKKLVEALADKYQDRAGGYTRIVASGCRPGDGASMAIIELV
ncbi:MAG: 50S ribosomal protein L17 [Patescibacteria group bacterium]